MDPLTGALVLGAAAQIGGGIMGYMASKDASKMAGEERAQMQALLQSVKEPHFDTSEITPEQYAVLQKYIPQVSDYVAEKEPELVKAVSEGAVKGREAQMMALEKLRGVAQSGQDEQSQALQAQAMRNAAIQNQGQQGAIIQDMARRGQGGSGMELQARLSAQQGANQTAAMGNQQAAIEAYRNKLQAMRDSANIGGDIRNQDVSLEERNVNAINNFNQRNTQDFRNWLANRDSQMNQGQQFNIGQAQTAADANVGGRNQAKQQQRAMQNQYTQQGFNNQMAKTGAQNNVSQAGIQDMYGAAKDKANFYTGIGGAVAGGAQGYITNDMNERKIKNEADYYDYLKNNPGAR